MATDDLTADDAAAPLGDRPDDPPADQAGGSAAGAGDADALADLLGAQLRGAAPAAGAPGAEAWAGMRVPPHSLSAEQALLGALMLENSTWEQVADKVREEDFYRTEHRLIFRAVAILAEQDQPFDVVTLAEALDKRRLLDDVGGIAYLAEIDRNTGSAANAAHYARIIRFNSVLRQLIRAGTGIADLAFDTRGRNESEILDAAETIVFRIAEQLTRGGGFRSIEDLLKLALDKIDELYHRDEPITGLPSGFADFDAKTSGLQPSDLIIVAGRPSMGKTSFAMNLAEHVAIKTGKGVAVFSMEMPGDSLAMRMISSLGQIDQHRVRTGKLGDEDWPRLTSAVTMLSQTPMFIDDTPALSPTDLRARVRRLARDLKRQEKELGMVVIDYLQLMQAPTEGENRATEISAISRSLKALAKELNIPVIALSQLNRSLESRPNKRPVMSDLRESGAIEQDADLIVFIYRDEVYHEDSNDKGIAEIIIAKQRNGPIGTVKLAFLGQYTRFENLAANLYDDLGYR